MLSLLIMFSFYVSNLISIYKHLIVPFSNCYDIYIYDKEQLLGNLL
jgi:hypothetical protein